MKITRKQMMDTKDAMTSIVNREMPAGSSPTAVFAALYRTYSSELRMSELHNNSLLARLGQREEKDGSYFIKQSDPNFQMYVEERTKFMMEAIDVAVEPVTISELDTLEIGLKPFEMADLTSIGVLVK